MTKIIAMIFINLATPKATGEHDLLLNLAVIKVKATYLR
jgi:hypothetical protein